MKKLKWPKWISILLWCFGIVVGYVAISWFWHAKATSWYFDDYLSGVAPDPFVTTPESLYIKAFNTVFYDFPSWYHKITDPLRYRVSPSGEPYFPRQSDDLNQPTPYLRAMKEPSLFRREKDDPNEYIRFTSLVPTNLPAISFRFTIKPDSTSEITLIKLDGLAGSYPGKISLKTVRAIQATEIDAIFDRIDQHKFWEPYSDSDHTYFLGYGFSHWFFERSTPNSYEVVGVGRLGQRFYGVGEEAIEESMIPHDQTEVGVRIIEKFSNELMVDEQ